MLIKTSPSLDLRRTIPRASLALRKGLFDKEGETQYYIINDLYKGVKGVKLKEWEKAFKALGQHLRLRIVALLAEEKLCVCELEEILGISQPAISQHLRVLKEADLVREEKVSQWVFYHLNKEKLAEVLRGWLVYVEAPLAEKEELVTDYQKLRQLMENPKVACRPLRKKA